MANITRHAAERIDERLTAEFGVTPDELVNRLAKVREANCQAWLAVSPRKVWVGESNGNGIAAIVRDGRATTILLRRTTQSSLMPKVVWATE